MTLKWLLWYFGIVYACLIENWNINIYSLISWLFIFVYSIFQSLDILYFLTFWDFPENLYEIDDLCKLILLIWFLTHFIFKNWFRFYSIFEGIFCWTNHVKIQILNLSRIVFFVDAKLVWISCVWFCKYFGIILFFARISQVFFKYFLKFSKRQRK